MVMRQAKCDEAASLPIATHVAEFDCKDEESNAVVLGVPAAAGSEEPTTFALCWASLRLDPVP
jgi:hypothetical protein